MKITPLEIRQHTFEKAMRGYNRDEVHAFLLSLSQEWEKMIEESKSVKLELDHSQKDVEKLREVESSLFKTLKTAEETGVNMVEQAKKETELMLKEAHMNSEALINDAKTQARNIIEEAEDKSKNTLLGMRDELQKLESEYRSLVNHKENLLVDMRNLANSLLEKTDRITKTTSNGEFKDHQQSAIEEINAVEEEVEKNPETTLHSSPVPTVKKKVFELNEQKKIPTIRRGREVVLHEKKDDNVDLGQKYNEERTVDKERERNQAQEQNVIDSNDNKNSMNRLQTINQPAPHVLHTNTPILDREKKQKPLKITDKIPDTSGLFTLKDNNNDVNRPKGNNKGLDDLNIKEIRGTGSSSNVHGQISFFDKLED